MKRWIHDFYMDETHYYSDIKLTIIFLAFQALFASAVLTALHYNWV